MWEPRADEKFEPSLNTKNAWTFTRKSAYTPAPGMRLPGLFTTKGFDTDALAVALVICLEAWGLISLVSSFGLFDTEGNFNLLGVGGVVAAFLLDLTLAIGRHLPAGRECRYKNQDVLAETVQEKQKLLDERGRLWLLSPVCVVLISALAALKIFIFYKLNENFTGLTASVFVSYLLAAIIHINNTGYFVAALWFSHKVKKDYKKWARSGPEAVDLTIHRRRPFNIVISGENKIKINLIKAGEHLIRAGRKEDNEATYVLETYGVLTDRGLADLVGQQPTADAKSLLARVGLAAQLQILDEDPPLPTSAVGPETQNKNGEVQLSSEDRQETAPASSVVDKV